MLETQRRRFYRLIYESRALLPPDADACAAALRDILGTARSRNIRSGVSGILFYNQRGFYQILEGNQTEVEATFAGIVRDRRHTDVNVSERGFARGRIFHSWSMAFVESPAFPKWSECSIQDLPAMLLTAAGDSLGRHQA